MKIWRVVAVAVIACAAAGCLHFRSGKPRGDRSLIAYYPFNGNANDLSGNGNNGIIHGAQSATGRLGDPNGSLVFNGTSDYIEVPDTHMFNFNQPITTAAWIYPEDARSGGIVGQWGYGGLAGDAFMLSMGNGHLRLTLPRPGLYSLLASTPLVTNSWRFVAMTYDGTVAKLYVNGKMDVSGNVRVAEVASNQSLKMGLEDIMYRGKHYFQGRISSVYLYSRALSDDEIKELYRRR
jgi:hypothetical protein